MRVSDEHHLKVLIIGPGLDGTNVGEVYSVSQWIKALTAQAEVTILSSQAHGRPIPVAEQYPLARQVHTWPEPAFLRRHFERFNAGVLPALPLFFAQVAGWIRRALAAGERFDVAHQINPQAMRYASPLRKFDMPYVVGPLGGGLKTPEAFRAEVGSSAPLITRLRALDGFRLRYDPWLRASYTRAGLILGVAPYVAEMLRPIPIRRFEAVLERANDGLAPRVARQAEPGRLSLLHVGRAVRTKGLRDMVRAMVHLKDLPGVTLTSAGEGEDLGPCREEAARLGVAERITFLGRVPREDIETLYERADVFAFPSFREPMGGVLFEALGWGLPIITAARGGPDCIVDESCGIRIPVTDPERYARDIAEAVRRLALDPAERLRRGAGARARLASFGTWEEKAARLIELYRETIAAGPTSSVMSERVISAPRRSVSISPPSSARRSARSGSGPSALVKSFK